MLKLYFTSYFEALYKQLDQICMTDPFWHMRFFFWKINFLYQVPDSLFH